MDKGIVPFQGKKQLLERCRELEFVDDVQDLKCSRCNRLALEHWYTNCGHALCPNCKRLLSGGGFKCPQCGQFIQHIEKQSADFEEKVNNLRAKCPNSKYGCPLIDTVKQLQEHLFGCKWTKEQASPATFRGTNTMQMLLEEVSSLKEQMDEMKGTNAFLSNELNERKKVEEEIKKSVELSVADIKSRLNGLSSDLHYEATTLKVQFKDFDQSKIKELLELKNTLALDINHKITTLEKAINEINLEKMKDHFVSKQEQKQMEDKLVLANANNSKLLIQMLDQNEDRFSQKLAKEVEAMDAKIVASEGRMVAADTNSRQETAAMSKMMENLKLLREEMDVMKAEASQKSIEMQANFNSQMETQKKIYNDELQKLATKVNNLESQTNNASLKNVTLDDEFVGLQKALDETNAKLKNTMTLKELGNKFFSKNDYKSRSRTKKEVNMLLMGQTGVGKSTFINALPYYLNYKNLKEAKAAKLHCIIPCSFALTDANYEEIVITYGNKDDGNENIMAKGESATQKCKSYLFEMEEFILRIIDTPSIGDTRGIDQDKLNMDNILDYISPFKQLHGICILLKPNEGRLTATFEYYIKQLLCHLHNVGGKNIIFVFTNSRRFSYKPGDTIMPLKVVINKLKSTIDIPLNENNIFCVDNEAFRYLIALKNNFKFQKVEFSMFDTSWKKSVTEYWRMMNLMTGKDRKPHEIDEILTLKGIKEMIITQSKVISVISQFLQQNYFKLNNHLNELKKYKKDCEELESKLYVPMILPKIEEFDEPMNVCMSKTCRKTVEKDGIKQYYYPTVCHSPCYLKGVSRNTDGFAKLKSCHVFGGGEYCNKCSCSYLEHQHAYSLIKLLNEKDKSSNTKLDEANDFKQKIDIIVNACEERIIKLKEEETLIIQNIANLEIFYKQNAILPYNDAFCKHLKLLINNEELLKADGADNESVIEGLKNMEERYKKEKELIEKASSSSDDKMSIEQAKRLIEKLFSLEFSGVILKKMLLIDFTTRSNELNRQEIKVPIKIRKCPQ